MESLVEGINSLHSLGYNPSSATETNKPPLPFSAKHPRCKEASSATVFDHGIDASQIPEGLVRNIGNAANEIVEMGVEDTSKNHPQSNRGNLKSVRTSDEVHQTKLNRSQKCASSVRVFNSSSLLVEAADLVLAAKDVGAHEDSPIPSKIKIGSPRPQKSTTQFKEAKQSFTNTEISESASSLEKSIESGEVSYSCDFAKSRKTSIRGSTGSDISDESSSSSLSSAINKPHKSNDSRWEAIQAIRSRDGNLGWNHFRLFKRVGCGDIGSVHLAELGGTKSYFAIKVMDKGALASRKKL